MGAHFSGVDALVETTVVRDSAINPTIGLGDGVVLVSVPALPASIQLSDCRVQASARAGVASFGSVVTLERTVFDCNSIHLNGERDYQLTGSSVSLAYSFDDRGSNACGCGQQSEDCTVLSAGLAPPEPLEEQPAPR